MYDMSSGTEYFGTNFSAAFSALSLESSIDGSYLVTHAGDVYRTRRTALSGGGITATYVFNPSTAQGRAGQACITSDVQYVYTASGAPYDFRGTHLTNRSLKVLPGTNYPSSILCLWNGVIIGGVDGYYAPADVWIYDGPSGTELAQRSSTIATGNRSLVDRGMAASADATRLVTLTQSTTGAEVRFQSVPGAL
jgi:hypothetical protein